MTVILVTFARFIIRGVILARRLTSLLVVLVRLTRLVVRRLRRLCRVRMNVAV